MDETKPLLKDGSTTSNYSNNGSENTVVSSTNRFKQICRLITVEPSIFCYLLVFSVQNILVTNFIIDKACEIHFNYTPEICKNLSHHSTENSNVQKYVTKINLYIALIESIPTIFSTLLLGSWGDNYGRKVPILLPLVGFLLSTLIFVINLIVWRAAPEYLLLASIPKAITGGLPCLLMTCYAYITDQTTTESRTMRIGLIDFSFAIGPLLGFIVADFAFKSSGYLGVFLFSATVTLLCIIYVIFLVKETTGKYKGCKYWCLDGPLPQNNFVSPASSSGFLGHIIGSLKTAAKSRPNFGRMKIFLCMIALSIMVSTYDIFAVEYLFANKVLHWTYLQYLHYLIFVTGIMSMGAPFLLYYLAQKMQFRDSVLSVVGSFMKMLSFFFESFVSRGWMIYAAGITGFLGFLPIIALRSAISKTVSCEEAGQVFSILSCIEMLVPLGSKTIFTLVYNSTLDVFPGAVFLTAAALLAIACLLSLTVLLLDNQVQRAASQ